MYKSIIFFALLLVAAIASADTDNLVGGIWKNCGQSNDIFQLGYVDISPSTPVKGKPLTVSIGGNLTQTITEGSMKLLVKYSFITLINKTDDLCKTSPCPIEAGSWNKTVTATIPSSVPSGKYTATVSAVDQNSSEVFCLSVAFGL
ncbi:hypothetical protein DFA_11828 [Cavenderia fasciculata]|uniref:MD-2-related lipid-recognition domain-containing protein n=1 Tax=Cavenderia fasciculata TaxID=261658 RepID=F4QEB8_CACFS|nr:uncharacterized protein DFA_11828 [Cavenderia fasciculata]EGG14065.1 hypothetical protein DFA_11828 [Cavenderia fasciculata]|eukprot:XP_004350773.1 hypothetical protein DFA_11828 [Cavenderia fasciculata]